MSIAEKHIRAFNSLNGQLVRKEELQRFLRNVQAEKLTALKELESKLIKAISQMNSRPAVLKFTPLSIPKEEKKILKKIFHPKPKKKTQVNGVPGKRSETPLVSIAKPSGITTDNKPVKKLPAGLMGFEDIAKMKFEKIHLTGEWKNEFGNYIYSDSQMMIWGMPGHGKTVKLLRFAQYLAAEQGLNVLYVANEEINRSTLTEKVNQFKIGHPRLKTARNIKDAGDISQFDVVFFDSVNSMGMNLKDYKLFVEDNPGRVYIPVVQCTKDGDFRGGQEWEHEVDIAGEVVNRKMILHKNRLDPDHTKKSEKLVIEKIVNEKKKKKLINETINNKLKEETESEVKTPKVKLKHNSYVRNERFRYS
jgi:hypothetical protein